MLESVSVVITCFNLERYILDAVSSVKNQDYAGEIQIIIVDDCSTDNSVALIEGLSGIELIRSVSNGGVMKAMIAGIRAARHDAIFFLDGDDFWDPCKIAICMTEFHESSPILSHDLDYIDELGNKIPRVSRVSQQMGTIGKDLAGERMLECILEHGDFIWLGSAFAVRRSSGNISRFLSFMDGIAYIETCYQDWPLGVWIALNSEGKATFLNRKLVCYRIHSENYSGSSQTLAKLQRNTLKARDTMRLIRQMMEEVGAESKYLRATKRIEARYALMVAIATGSRRDLFSELVRSMPKAGGIGVVLFYRVCVALIFGAALGHYVFERTKLLKSFR